MSPELTTILAKVIQASASARIKFMRKIREQLLKPRYVGFPEKVIPMPEPKVLAFMGDDFASKYEAIDRLHEDAYLLSMAGWSINDIARIAEIIRCVPESVWRDASEEAAPSTYEGYCL